MSLALLGGREDNRAVQPCVGRSVRMHAKARVRGGMPKHGLEAFLRRAGWSMRMVLLRGPSARNELRRRGGLPSSPASRGRRNGTVGRAVARAVGLSAVAAGRRRGADNQKKQDGVKRSRMKVARPRNCRNRQDCMCRVIRAGFLSSSHRVRERRNRVRPGGRPRSGSGGPRRGGGQAVDCRSIERPPCRTPPKPQLPPSPASG